MKFDQDLCLNLQYDFGKMSSTLGSVVPLAMFQSLGEAMSKFHLVWTTQIYQALNVSGGVKDVASLI